MAESSYLVRGALVAPQIAPELADKTLNISDAFCVVPGRARDGAAAVCTVAGDQIARIEFDNGFVLYSRADDLIEEQGVRPATRSGQLAAWEISQFTSARAEVTTRGAVAVGIKVLHFFGIDLKGKAATALGSKYEESRLERQTGYVKGKPGLYRCSLDDPFTLTPLDQRPVAKDGPLLVFIHGTGSSCQGGFGALWDPANPEGRAARVTLKEKYQERVFAFEHRSFTESPIKNALDLVNALPAGAEVHLVTHSRGGLIGELLALSGCGDLAKILSADRVRELFSADRTMAQQLGLSPLDSKEAKDRDTGYEVDRKGLLGLVAAFAVQELKVSRFVRVACPARGTTLASGRLDRWLSMLNFVTQKVDKLGLVADGVDFLLQVVKERTDPRTLPGIEAMMPGSALTRLLNNPELMTSTDLSVIAGDIEGDSFWSKIKLVMVDWFYGADHDLVVNTGSMTGGLARSERKARFHLDSGGDVAHSSYFVNARSVRWLVAGLMRTDVEEGGYLPLSDSPQDIPRWRSAVARSRASGEPRPLAIVLPGTMGTHLKSNSETVWLAYVALMRGGLTKLGLNQTQVVPGDLIDSVYGPLVEFLARTHRVEMFGYDWRLSIHDAGEKLAQEIETWLPQAERVNQAVHIVAHSMGGLVVRAMLALPDKRGENLWRRITRLPASRFLMLGTPNYGSYEAVRWLTGSNPTQTKLALLDVTLSALEIAGLVGTFPGLLELLPWGNLLDLQPVGQARRVFTKIDLWEQLRQRMQGDSDVQEVGWTLPTAAALRKVQESWDRLAAGPVDKRYMCYVAGVQPQTIIDYSLTEYRRPAADGRKQLEFQPTEEGDGTVPWASGQLGDIPLWYAEDTAHDALCSTRRLFPGYLDLLTTGTTRRLASTPPARRRTRGEATDQKPLAQSPPADSIPSGQDLRLFSFGGEWTPPSSEDARLAVPMIEVSLRHGDLAYSRHPVMVGHYEGDTIVSAEAYLDRQLKGALTRRLALGLYPGAPNTHGIFFQEARYARPAGAIVVGLGRVGSLTAATLEACIRTALLECALQVAQWPDDRFGKPGAPRSIAISCVLIGSGAGQLSVRSSIESVLHGAVAANARIVAQQLDNRVLIDKIEFVEVYEDLALVAWRALRNVIEGGAFEKEVRCVEPGVIAGEAGRRRASFDEAPGWWQRLEILEDENNPDMLRFVFATDRARAEETLALGQRTLADAFVRRASASVVNNQEISRTLFEMLLPVRLKESAPWQGNLVLMLDSNSARYPWEMLENRWSENGRPPAVTAGLVRQLKTPTFRTQPAYAREKTALVIGNPNLEGWSRFPDLPGARREAGRVAQVLGSFGCDVSESIDENSEQILGALHRNAWRIMHFAGHGEHDFLIDGAGDVSPAVKQNGPEDSPAASQCTAQPRRVSGMIIGKNTFLTPGDIAQMRWVPELVFINCCHLGRTDAAGDRVGLAANLGVEFIQMGARAVIAAGWAVEDSAADAFTEAFYHSFLAGQTFGDSVRAAREATWQRFPNVNTWGAYQCYGDQSYRLQAEASGSAVKVVFYATPGELVIDLDNRTAALRVGSRSADDIKAMAGQVDEMMKAIPESERTSWERRADVSAALGFLYAELRNWDRALEWFEIALAGDGDCPIRAIEQAANIRSRRAAANWFEKRESLGAAASKPESESSSTSTTDPRDSYVKEIDRAIAELNVLVERGKTFERHNLVGSAYKRLSMLLDGEKRQNALKQAADSYDKALKMKPRGYAFTNWAVMQLLSDQASGASGKTISEGLTKFTESLQSDYDNQPDFWTGAGLGDLKLVDWLGLCLSKAAADTLQTRLEEAATLYLDAIGRAASPREISSLVENLEFLMEMLGDEFATARDALSALRGRLQ